MFFSDHFGVDPSVLSEYGAADISLICDMPLHFVKSIICSVNCSYYVVLHKFGW